MCFTREEFEEAVHVLGFVHVPRSPPLALGVFMARHSLPVNLLALPLPPQILLLLLLRRRHVQVKAGLREGEILSGHKTGCRILPRKQPGRRYMRAQGALDSNKVLALKRD